MFHAKQQGERLVSGRFEAADPPMLEPLDDVVEWLTAEDDDLGDVDLEPTGSMEVVSL